MNYDFRRLEQPFTDKGAGGVWEGSKKLRIKQVIRTFFTEY